MLPFAIVGAGSVGLNLGGRLAQAGHPVTFVTRSEEAANAIAKQGIEIEAAVAGEANPDVESIECDAVSGIEALRGHTPDDTCIILATRAHATEALATTLGRNLPNALVVCAQNDIDNESIAARHCQRVAGMVVRQTTTRIAPGRVRAAAPGRLIAGAHSSGIEAETRAITQALQHAGFDASLSPRIENDKWLKLCINLMTAPNALARRSDHGTRAFVETKVRLLEEGRDVLAAAGISCAPCDERDRTLEAEIEHQRGALQRGEGARPAPLFNSVWSALESGAELEADRFHERVIELGERCAVPTPVNARVLEVLRRAYAEGKRSECCGAEDLLP